MLTTVFGHKHTGKVRFGVKTMCKKLNFSGFIYSVKITGKVGEKESVMSQFM